MSKNKFVYNHKKVNIKEFDCDAFQFHCGHDTYIVDEYEIENIKFSQLSDDDLFFVFKKMHSIHCKNIGKY